MPIGFVRTQLPGELGPLSARAIARRRHAAPCVGEGNCPASRRLHGFPMRRSPILFASLIVCSGCSIDEVKGDEGGAGTIRLDLGTGKDSFWIDTDGVSPEVPGCH